MGSRVSISQAATDADFWHLKPDGSRPMFNGAHGQRVIIDLNTQALVVQTAVTTESDWLAELQAIVDRAGEM